MHSCPFWRLRPRDEIPLSVEASIPGEDTLAFLALLAAEPLSSFSDALIQKSLLREAKERYRRRKIGVDMPLPGLSHERHHASVSSIATTDDEASEYVNVGSLSPLQAPKSRRAGSVRRQGLHKDGIPIGPMHQADIPQWNGGIRREDVQEIESECVFRPSAIPKDKVDKFLKVCNQWLVRKSGYPLSPMAEERALTELMREKGAVDIAVKRVLKSIASYRLFPGEGHSWSDSERALFLRTLAYMACDFEYMSRKILTQRKTSEIVVYYYARYKQIWHHYGGSKLGDMFDRGDEEPPGTDRGTTAQVSSLQALAASAGDGFPPERRMERNMLLLRDARVNTMKAEKRLADDGQMWR